MLVFKTVRDPLIVHDAFGSISVSVSLKKQKNECDNTKHRSELGHDDH